MHRATQGWVGWLLIVLLLLSAMVGGCTLLEDETATPQSMLGESPEASPRPVEAEDVESEPEETVVAQDVKPEKPVASASSAPEEGSGEATPQATADPALDDWTILIYMSAGPETDAPALQALDDIQAAGQADGVNVVVQLDRNGPSPTDDGWQGARRFHVTGETSSPVGSQFVEELGPTNMGDPDSLTAFITWGQEQFPANHTALLLWGEGRGWRGLMQDAGDEDDLSLADLSGALSRVEGRRGSLQLDVLAFSEGMTASLEILSAVQPFSRYAVASPGLLSPEIWQYEALLNTIYAESPVSAARFAQLMVNTGLQPSTDVRPAITGLTVVDLERLPAVQLAFGELSELLAQGAENTIATVSAGRHHAQFVTFDDGGRERRGTSIDVARFAHYLAQWSPSIDVARAGDKVVQAMAEAVTNTSVAVDPGSGVSVAFLAPSEAADTGYDEAVSAVWPGAEGWLAAQQAFYEVASTITPLADAVLSAQQGESVGVENPVLLGLTLRALHLNGASLVGLQPGEAGESRLLFVDPLAPEIGPDGPPNTWPDGVTQREMIWNTTAPYISDGANGGFTPLWTSPGAGDQPMALASYLPAGEGAAARDVVLFFDQESRQLTKIWQAGGEATAPRTVTPEDGASLQLKEIYVEDNGLLRYEPGVTLVYSSELEIRYDLFPLTSRDYRVGLLADGAAGASLLAPIDLTVSNEDVTPGFQTYLNAAHGFQFQFPVGWPEPVFDGRQVSTAARQRGPGLTISLYEGADRRTAAALKREALDSFGLVDILHEEDVVAGGSDGLLTAYGYDAADGPHTGVLITFVDADEGIGYVVDVDGLSLDETRTLEIASHLVSSWRFTPIRSANWPEQWRTTQRGALAVTLPQSYEQATLENGWERFSDGSQFLAMRTDSVTGRSREAIGQHWLGVASRGVDGFAAEDVRLRTLGGAIWSEAAFGYEDGDETVAGVILSTIYGGQEVVAWSEGPGETFDVLWQEQFLFAVAGSLPDQPRAAGVMLEDTFDGPSAWGVGEQDGATGEVQEGVYEMAVDATRGFFWTSNGMALADGAFEVDAVQVGGAADSGYGLLLRADNEAQSFYVFEISSDGYAWIGWCEASCARATTLAGEGWISSESIEQGLNATNRLRVDVSGTQMVFYVNDVQVAEIEDSRAVAGAVGLFVETLGEGGAVVQFDNLRAVAP